jgi:arginine repressor
MTATDRQNQFKTIVKQDELDEIADITSKLQEQGKK